MFPRFPPNIARCRFTARKRVSQSENSKQEYDEHGFSWWVRHDALEIVLFGCLRHYEWITSLPSSNNRLGLERRHIFAAHDVVDVVAAFDGAVVEETLRTRETGHRSICSAYNKLGCRTSLCVIRVHCDTPSRRACPAHRTPSPTWQDWGRHAPVGAFIKEESSRAREEGHDTIFAQEVVTRWTSSTVVWVERVCGLDWAGQLGPCLAFTRCVIKQ